MKNDQPHSVEDSVLHALDHFVGDLVVGPMSPPDEHVGGRERVARQPVLRLVQRGRANLQVLLLGERSGDRLVNPIGVETPRLALGLLVPELVPDRYA